jgi:hypothetical protein
MMMADLFRVSSTFVKIGLLSSLVERLVQGWAA